MQATYSIPERPTRHFLDDNFETKTFEVLRPYYEDLLNREINNVGELKKWLRDFSEMQSIVGEEIRWRYVKTSIDTTDKKAQDSLTAFYQDIEPQSKVYRNQLKSKINDCIYTKELEKDPDFRNFLKGIAIDLSIFKVENIEIQKELSIMENEYANISGKWTIEYKGEELTFQQAAMLLKDEDRSVRELAYKRISEKRLQDEKTLDDLYTDLVKKRHQVAVNADFKNYRDFAFAAKHRFDYTAADCKDFQDAISSTIVPILNDLAEERKELMGLDNLRPWDTAIDPLGRGSLKPFNSTEEFIDKTIRCFDSLDEYFGERIAIMKEMEYLDLESRLGKAPGGYNMTMPEIGVPFIFMNHAKSEGDVRVMVHEGGHAVHTFLAHPLEYDFFKDYPSEVAELASMSMELFSMEKWDAFYDNEEDLNRAKKNHLVGLLGTLPGVAKGDEFQHWVYLNPTHTLEERKNKWEELHSKFGSAVIDYTGLEKERNSSYQRILHFYQVPFYYIEYGFAQLGAIAMWKNFKENPERTLNQYKKALSLGYTRSIPEIYEAAGIRFDFSKKYISDLASFVKEEIEKLGK